MRTLRYCLLLILTYGAMTWPLYAQEADRRDTFAKAYALYSAGKLADARELFEQTLNPAYRLADYSIHFLAMIAFNERNWDLSRQLWSQLKNRFPQSVWFHQAQLQLVKIDLAENKYAQVIAALRSLRSTSGVKSEIFEESLRLEAQAQEAQGEVTQANALYQELRTSYPHSRWTAEARKEQARFRDKYPEVFGLPTIHFLAEEADQLTREREYREAEILYKKLLHNVTEADFRLHALTKLAGLYLTLRRRSDAIPILAEIARDYAETMEAPKALYQIGQILWNRNDNYRALGYFKMVMERYPAGTHADRAQFAAADIYESFGEEEVASRLYSELPKQYPRSQVRDDATWRLAWLHYRTGNLQKAVTAFAALAEQASNGSWRNAALYWQARSAEKSGDQDSAKRLYRQVVHGTEESYYHALAERALERLGLTFENTQPTKAPSTPEADPPMSAEISFHLSRARELAAIALHRMAVVELDEVNRQSKTQNRLRPILMREYFRNQAYGRSLYVANQLPSSHIERDRFRFPLAFWELIQQKAQERGIDPYLIVALIRQESLFDAQARSPAFALGLMQLLPSTAGRVARQLGLKPPDSNKLFEPEINLTLGTQYLRDLLQRYSNNWFKALAAYNAGEAAVDRWEREIASDDIEEFVERIPYVETRGYVKLVMRNHRIYKRLYHPGQ